MTENWLILETSGRVARVGLVRSGALVGRAELDSSRRHAREMMPTIGALLKAESLSPPHLTGVMAGTGPGSYTGLRVGLVTAKALAYALGCELRAVGAFPAIAHQAPPGADRVWVIADALQGQVYAQSFALRPDGWFPASALQILPVGEFAAGLTANDWLSGPGLSVYEAQLPGTNPRVVVSDREPRVESVFAVGKRLAPLTREELFALEPLYLRGSSAEEKAKEPRG
ncbi:MAG TPA: tRNA (adenosine(37)-N6)-threonylcarbamoyltransferase complex dimerization subunit type 1 TsaB [Gemmata sp.]